ncbi:uncharacterized protein B0I36DRAFT_356224 [Microdochium trichocladiopsis]|uniref:Uncharacterized protein n=1 Tax=Microdochium trichocladiopsis TaxID=1682393 RepID=A0A9P8XQK0_9PEZI|nr:uncharacterized protein B0I36DRAFT_356224 [Microdochium trichocladiopsis]KAH7012128.1 hypothetical protein B0I36DRAFT_356224 [Microdochium trichocladiopsis]
MSNAVGTDGFVACRAGEPGPGGGDYGILEADHESAIEGDECVRRARQTYSTGTSRGSRSSETIMRQTATAANAVEVQGLAPRHSYDPVFQDVTDPGDRCSEVCMPLSVFLAMLLKEESRPLHVHHMSCHHLNNR